VSRVCLALDHRNALPRINCLLSYKFRQKLFDGALLQLRLNYDCYDLFKVLHRFFIFKNHLIFLRFLKDGLFHRMASWSNIFCLGRKKLNTVFVFAKVKFHFNFHSLPLYGLVVFWPLGTKTLFPFSFIFPFSLYLAKIKKEEKKSFLPGKNEC
jgi:hypothetical protein